ncbi:hypothetical protein [Halobacteriovorax sp. HLS]|uniref:hypothetical protein n=1 Tax=Halobacteriovorax sp. HLS TaxID=2234000 RepID=UPI000FD956AC|nr:hypothetical protein [Halobacteriovorax sp. HLS]
MKLIIIFLTLLNLSLAQEPKKSKEELESELVDFSKIKDVIKSDGLEAQAKKKSLEALAKKKKRLEKNVSRFNYPTEHDFWPFMSEYWIVKNAPILKWDMKKPDYGLEDSFKRYLEELGYYEVKFKILLVDSPNITHFSLPYRKNEILFLLSVPFIRTMDLSKLEISTLLLEDYLRIEKRYFHEMVTTKELTSVLGTNFHGKKVNPQIVKDILKKYDDVIFSTGFNFKQQFAVTKDMERVLKNNMKLWNSYFSLLRKIDKLVKENVFYDKYNKIYPSPELQINWLTPNND